MAVSVTSYSVEKDWRKDGSKTQIIHGLDITNEFIYYKMAPSFLYSGLPSGNFNQYFRDFRFEFLFIYGTDELHLNTPLKNWYNTDQLNNFHPQGTEYNNTTSSVPTNNAFFIADGVSLPITNHYSNSLMYGNTVFLNYNNWNSNPTWNYSGGMVPRAMFFNMPVRIGDNVTSCANMFQYYRLLNSEIVIGNNVTNCSSMFYGCTVFNKPVTIPDSVSDFNFMFSGCHKFNQPVTIPDRSDVNCVGMFGECRNFDQPITIPKNVTSIGSMFECCIKLNWNNVIWDTEYATTQARINTVCGRNPFNYTRQTNSYIPRGYFAGNYANYNWTNSQTYYANQFNLGPIHIGDNVKNCYNMFNNYSAFNKTVYLGNNVWNCSRMFYNATSFNSLISLPLSVINCSEMFAGARTFNQPFILSENVQNCYSMFDTQATGQTWTGNFNQDIKIPKNVQNCKNMFRGQMNFSKNIYIDNSSIGYANVIGLLNNTNNSLPINVYCNDLSVLNNTTAAGSITGFAMTWAPILNGYYSAATNIFIYNNMPDNI